MSFLTHDTAKKTEFEQWPMCAEIDPLWGIHYLKTPHAKILHINSIVLTFLLYAKDWMKS